MLIILHISHMIISGIIVVIVVIVAIVMRYLSAYRHLHCLDLSSFIVNFWGECFIIHLWTSLFCVFRRFLLHNN
jgi:hypothetical protein